MVSNDDPDAASNTESLLSAIVDMSVIEKLTPLQLKRLGGLKQGPE